MHRSWHLLCAGGGRVACLLDPRTVRVLDLATGAALATIAHDCKIDWLVRGLLCDGGPYMLQRGPV